MGQDGCEYSPDLGLRKTRIFFLMGLDKAGKSVLAAQGVLPAGQHEQ
jgi:hypothetical protein